MPWVVARSGGWRTSWPRIWVSTTRSIARLCRNSGHRRAWPERAGLKAVDLFDAIDSGRVKAVWIMATNPVVSLPDADIVRRALKRCPLVIVSDCVAANDTLPFAHIRLPAAGWAEKDGTVTNSDRHVSQAACVSAAGGSGRGRTGGSSAKSPGGWASPGLRFRRARCDLRRVCAPHGTEPASSDCNWICRDWQG